MPITIDSRQILELAFETDNLNKNRQVVEKKDVIKLNGLFTYSLAERKKIFLNSLLSPSGKTKYKRYLGAPIRYAGGKSLAVGLIVDLIPDNTKRIISPFLGAGSVEVACAVELGVPVIGYDIFEILINYWDVQLHNPEALRKRLLKFEPSRKGFKKIKDRLKRHWEGKEKFGKFDLAAYFYFNHNTSYGPHFLGWPSSVYLQPERYQKMIEKVRDFRVENMQVGCLSFEKVMAKYPNDFFYCDPPYYLDGDSKTFVGLYPHRNFPIYHKGFKHEELRDLLKTHKGGFILSYNDCSTIREWYKDFDMIAPSWQYTFSQGDTRIGENRLKNNNGHYVKKSHELFNLEIAKMTNKRGLTSEGARKVRQKGHDDALAFAIALGLDRDYKNDLQAKKDVIDPSGDAHSVKSGEKKWQVFLYGQGRFERDDAFRVMNGIGDLLIECIKSFPSSYDKYQRDKNTAKQQLRISMVSLKMKLQERPRLRAFINKSLFNGGEVRYLTVKHKDLFHIFLNEEVVQVLGDCLEVCNSRAISKNQTPEQKVLFRYKGKNLGELEMRNDSPVHYQEVRFNMLKPRIMEVLFEKIPFICKYSDSVLVYGKASKHFGRWKK